MVIDQSEHHDKTTAYQSSVDIRYIVGIIYCKNKLCMSICNDDNILVSEELMLEMPTSYVVVSGSRIEKRKCIHRNEFEMEAYMCRE